MKFLAIFGLVSTLVPIVLALRVWALLVAWLPIWTAVLLYSAANRVRAAHYGGDDHQLLAALARLRTYFKVIGFFTLVALGFNVVMGVVILLSR
ncbi:MAG: hypothetical protein JXR37_10515 [Kiritimatiellae bacterium]|nr:hypothetical protein [Kiritimatiellia bacterium]